MPETTPYLILGLVAVTIIMGAFIASLVTRYRSLEKDVETLERLKDE
jgi:ABC-type polysaccharide/polyol phosphate export permease